MIRTSLLFVTVLFFSSCIGPREYTPVTYYDLGIADFKNLDLSIGSIVQEGPYKSRMVHRVEAGKIMINESKRWTLAPDLMLTHYLKKCFKPGGKYTLNGEIITFENEQVNNQAVFTFHYTISENGRVFYKGFFKKTKPAEFDAESFADSMGKMAKELTKEIAEQVKLLK